MIVIKNVLFLVLLLLIFSCNNTESNKGDVETGKERVKEGEKLALVYCSSCHLMPEPGLLDKTTWEKGVLPQMGPRLGIFEFKYQRYPYVNDGALPKNYYPPNPVMTNEQWQSIIDYYVAAAPDSLRTQPQNKISDKLSLFSAVVPSVKYDNPSTSFVKIAGGESLKGIFICDLFTQTIYRFNKSLHVLDSMKSSGAIVDIDFQKEGMLSCNIGTFNPTNFNYGEARYIRMDSIGRFVKDKNFLFDNLKRPVQIVSGDLNKDGREDYLVSEFGYLTGSLAWMEKTENSTFKHHVLRDRPGAVRAYIQDYNKDGLNDVWALFAQGEEGVFLYTNKGKGQFEEKQVLRFPPSYGSSYFELVDFNKDGYSDIIYTCGDNADYSNILKPYHGVYIFLNDGKNHFKQKYFFHINGCYRAVARDYDNDGDMDIATIAYFADYEKHPEEGFVYLENNKNVSFKPYTLPITKQGRWMTMDAGDVDGDGKIDLLLGNFSLGPTMMKSSFDWRKGPPFIVLKNNSK